MRGCRPGGKAGVYNAASPPALCHRALAHRRQSYFAIEEIAQIQEFDIRTVIGDANAARRRKEGLAAPLRKALHRAACAVKSHSGKALLRKRCMHLERSFEHVTKADCAEPRSKEQKISLSGTRSRRPALT